MKFRLLLLSSIILLASFKVTAQANLVLSSTISIASNTFAKGDYLTFSFSVKNTGNVTAPKSHTSIYLSQTTSSSAGILLSELSCDAIAANQQSSTINYIFPVPYNIPTGANYIIFEIDSRSEVVESNESNVFYLTSPITITSNIISNQNLPYPVLFIHGLNSDDKTWNSLISDLQNYFGWSYGGNINFCLNQSSTSTDKINDVQSWTSVNSLSKGDFYTLNFDVDRSGNPYPVFQFIYSNQASIVKQGIAVKEAISYILTKTGKDKVILVGHSMGGLASREYLQNLKQPDGKHHVAKLLTVGTPHGGSNSTSFGFSIAVGLYEKSEALRDLRTTYLSHGDSGVYLFGGREYYTRMQDGSLYFTNVDVNCNGIDNAGDSITGLNKKPIPQDLSYSCIIGTGNALGGDGVVDEDKANLKNYYPSTLIDTFNIDQPLSISLWHSKLPEQTEAIVKGLDESNEYYLSYGIDTGKTYFANFSKQKKTGYPYDFDDYKIIVQQTGVLNVKLYDIQVSKCYFRLLNISDAIIYSDSTNGQGYYEFNRNVTPGTYYIEFYATPENNSWYFPYAFNVSVLCQTAVISLTGNTTTCSTNLPVLTSSSSFGNQWYFNNVAISGANSNTYTPSISGNYRLITLVNGCVSNPSNPVTVTINQPPTASVTPSGTLQVCSGASATLTANTGTGLTYQWKKNGTNEGGAISSSYSATQAGVYNVLITDGNGCSSLSNSITIVVNPILTPTVSISVSPVGSVPYGTQVIFTAHSTNGGSSPVFQWYKNSVIISGVPDSVYSSSTLSESDSIKCVLISSAPCVSSMTAISNTIVCSRFNLYTFIGNGNWDQSSNWSNNIIPPSIITARNKILINPITNGECVLNVQQFFEPGSILTISPSKKFKIPGNIDVYNSAQCLPIVTTNTIDSIGSNKARSGGLINNQGCLPILAKGVVWSTSPSPTISLSTKTIDGTGSGSFNSNLVNLSSNTTYYVRAYATNAFGTSYGNELSVTTLPAGYMSISALRALYSGTGLKLSGPKVIAGTVTSDISNGNIIAGNVIIQDATGAIQIYFGGTITYALGDSIVLDITNDSLINYRGSLELKGAFGTTPPTPVATGRIVMPMVKTIAEINNSLSQPLGSSANFESMLVQIQNATIAAGTYSGNKNLNDGSATITLYTAPAALFSGATTPSGAKNWTCHPKLYFSTKEVLLRNINDVQ